MLFATAQGRTIVVSGNGGPGVDETTIGRALEVAEPGDTIRIRAGVYSESLTLISGVSLEGDGAERVTLTNSGLIVRAQDVTEASISGVTFKGGSAGSPTVLLYRSSVIIEHCDFTGAASRGLEVQEIAEPVIRSCRFVNLSGAGVFFAANATGLMESCVISGCGTDGISVGGSSSPSIVGCLVQNNGQNGLFAYEQSSPQVRRSLFKSNRLHGALVQSKASPSFDACQFQNNAATGILSQDGAPTVRDSVVRHNLQQGIAFKGGSGRIEGTTVLGHTDYQPAMLMEARAAFAIKNCVVALNGFSGLLVRSGATGSVSFSTFYMNRNEGIWVKDGRQTSINHCLFVGQHSLKFGIGLSIWPQAKATAMGNVAWDNAAGNYKGLRPDEQNLVSEVRMVRPELLDLSYPSTAPEPRVGDTRPGASPDAARFDINLPQKLEAWLGGEALAEEQAVASRQASPTPKPTATPIAAPIITIFSDISDTSSRRHDLAFTIESPAPLTEVTLTLNGKAQFIVDPADGKALRRFDVDTEGGHERMIFEYRLDLLPGPNRIEIVAETEAHKSEIDATILRVRR